MISSGPVLRPASPSTARRLSVPRCHLESPDYSRRCRWSMKPRVLPPLHGAAPRRCRLAVLGTIGHAAANSQDLFSPASCSAIFCRDLEGPSRCTTTSQRLSVYSDLRNSQRRSALKTAIKTFDALPRFEGTVEPYYVTWPTNHLSNSWETGPSSLLSAKRIQLSRWFKMASR